MKNYVVATIRPWNKVNYNKHFGNKGNFHLIEDPEMLTLELLDEIKPVYIFFPHWSWIIPKKIYEKYTCVVFHMTDLPYGRGGTPLQNLIVRGIYKTKISAIKAMDGIDSGPVYLKRDLDIRDGSAEEIFRKVSDITFDMIEAIILKNPKPKLQVGKVVEFRRRKVEESRIPDGLMGRKLYDFIRMLDAPEYPKAFLESDDLRFEFSQAKIDGNTVCARVEIIRIKNE